MVTVIGAYGIWPLDSSCIMTIVVRVMSRICLFASRSVVVVVVAGLGSVINLPCVHVHVRLMMS